jgi:hypothetical protein
LVRLDARGGGQQSAAHGAAVPAKGGGSSGGVRWNMLPSWAEQLGRRKVFGPGEEGGSSGLRWAKKPERLGPAWEFTRKIQIRLPRPTG